MNSIRKYSAANVTIFGFLLTYKVRFKIEDNKVSYAINNRNARTLGERKIDKYKYKLDKVFDLIFVNRVDLKIKYGVKDDAMRTALEASAISNILMFIRRFIRADRIDIEVTTEYNSELLAIDLDITTRFTIVQIILIIIRIIQGRRKNGKYREHNAVNSV